VTNSDPLPPDVDEPVVILTGARSGSTLLRLILDAHPTVACPPETNIIKACAQLVTAWRVMDDDLSGQLPDPVRQSIGTMLRDLVAEYLTRRGKQRWCEKSLGTATVAGQFLEIYPKTKFICLYRHCMDVIYSGLEASPWGLTGYGFEQFGGLFRNNNISAMAAYWIEHTSQILRFEQEHSDSCLRVYYEQLVTDPDHTAGEIFSFIGVAAQPDITQQCFSFINDIDGPGDHKLHGTNSIVSRSVGRGARLPVGMIPAPQLMAVNQLLGSLGYAPVDQAWRRGPYPPVLLSNGNDHTESDDAVPAAVLSTPALAAIDNVLRSRLKAGLSLAFPAAASRDADADSRFALVAYHGAGGQLVRTWCVDPVDRSVTAYSRWAEERFNVRWLVTADMDSWLAVLSGQQSAAVAFRSGTLRYIGLDTGGEDSGADRQDGQRSLARIAAVKRFLACDPIDDIVRLTEEDS
jgi:Sulfotransferase family